MAVLHFQHAGITTTATTADQVITSFTPDASVEWRTTIICAFLTTFSTTDANLGKAQFQTGGTDCCEVRKGHTDGEADFGVLCIPLWALYSDDGVTVWRWVTTPAATTSMRWTASFFGNDPFV